MPHASKKSGLSIEDLRQNCVVTGEPVTKFYMGVGSAVWTVPGDGGGSLQSGPYEARMFGATGMSVRLRLRTKYLMVMAAVASVFVWLLSLSGHRPTNRTTAPPAVVKAAEGKYSEVPLSQAQYLKDVIEPISMIDSHSFDDGGSIGLVFRDSTGNEKSIVLLENLDNERNVVFGVCVAHSKERRVTLAGDEEKALLGLLDRWYWQDPDATKWNDRIDGWLSSGRGHFEQVWGEPLAKLRAVCILRALRSRN
jgi:hypothetical protein